MMTFPVVILGAMIVNLVAFAANSSSAMRADGHATPFTEYRMTNAECPALAIISHGFGGNERGLPNLAAMLANNGFRVLVMGHQESGPAQLRAVLKAKDRRAALIKAAGDPAAFRARFLDLDAIWKMATTICRPPFSLFIGHSMGAQTVMMEASAKARIGPMGRDRFDAYVALSPQGVGLRFNLGAWAQIRKPVLMITGTKDKGVDGDYTTRLSAFHGLPTGLKWLAIVKGASHMNLGERGFGRKVRLIPGIVIEFASNARAGRDLAPRPVSGVEFHSK